MKPLTLLIIFSSLFINCFAQDSKKHIDISKLELYGDMSWIKNALIRINAADATYTQANELDSADIVKIELYKKKYAIPVFGKEEGRNGVILITTRKKANETKSIITISDSVQYYMDGADTIYILPKAEKGFVGGSQAWQKFLIKNLQPSLPVDNGAPAGIYIVNADFVIDEQGKPIKITISNDPGYGTGKEVIRILKISAPWKIVYLNGMPVKAALKQQVTFMCSVE